MMLPMPQLPQSAHDVTIDDLPSKPIDVQHSWTYPGFGCGTLLKPQFDNSVLYAQAQQIAFYKSTHVAQVTKPLMPRPRPRPCKRCGTTSSSRRLMRWDIRLISSRLRGFRGSTCPAGRTRTGRE